MAGHSKWANIKHKKAKMDAQKGKLFTKLGREIIVAAKAGGGDPASNFRLKIAIENAKAANMPSENIQRAIQKGIGGGEGSNYEELRYEGYGPGGVAIMVTILTDNRNRTAGEMRHIFSKNGGNLGETGCVSWMFQEKGRLTISRSENTITEDELLLLILEWGALDYETDEEFFRVYTKPADLEKIRQAFIDEGIVIEEAAVSLVPINTVVVSDVEQAKKVIKLIDTLEDHDDVQNVYTNFELSDALADIEF